MTMRLYQPVLFVGLGGTGCQVGAELERRLREEICGPDGADFQRRRSQAGASLLPYQLPSCVQFVYADVNQADLDRLPARVVPGPEHFPAVHQTAHYVRDLVPQVDTYPEVAASLRLTAGPVVQSWLPPRDGEPRVAPLQRGAGQLPTVGRAALFETFRGGVTPAVDDLRAAVGNISNSGEDLSYLGGRNKSSGVDVFVAFSVAGGTGAGIFYDYLHLIGHVFEGTRFRPRIYPLVLMPSAFREGLGGGRPAQLNAGRALLDLFRLVDQQNGGDVQRNLRTFTAGRVEPVDPEDAAVVYPVEGRVRLKPSTAQTAFLFSLPVGAEKDDLHRSMVSFVMSMVGSEVDQEKAGPDAVHGQSFADSFINDTDRQVPAANGIGGRGVSTALVASMTIPDDELADLVAGRMLSAAVIELNNPLLGAPEENKDLIERFFKVSGLGDILVRPGTPFPEPAPVTGASDIAAALTDRADAMKGSLAGLDRRLRKDMPGLVAQFDPRTALNDLLRETDLFRALRVGYGHPQLRAAVDRSGAEGVMQQRVAEPAAPRGFQAAPPTVPEMHDRWGMIKVKWADQEPVEARETQDQWYRWRTQVLWSRHWKDLRQRWRPAMDQAGDALRGVTDALLNHARLDAERFGARAEGLARNRVGVSYLLPPGGDLDQFYLRVRQALIDHHAAQGALQPNSRESDLVRLIIGTEGWRQAYRDTLDVPADVIVARLRERIKTALKTFFRSPPPGRPPLIPPLSDRLAGAAGLPGAPANLSTADVQEFRGKLHGLVPGAFEPQGGGPMRVLVTYPAGARNVQIEQYLQSTVRLPAQAKPEFRTTQAESLSVVLFRTSMGVTEVREVREVLRAWSGAQFRQQPEDHLRWRQRTGYNFTYLATREEHRIQILHRILNALWNGKVELSGDPASPTEIAIVLGGDMVMSLPLSPLGQASSWPSVLRTYEQWTLDDDNGFRGDFCRELMMELPDGVESRAKPPSKAYLAFREASDVQPAVLERMLEIVPAGGRPRVTEALRFWRETFGAALDLSFTGTEATVVANLRELEDSVTWPDAGAGAL